MGKKRGKVDRNHHKKRKSEIKKINPFEIKVNKQKHHVLGRKLSKHEIGLPGQSRTKSVKKRKDTLLHEYEQRFKSSKFVDKRIGENDSNLSYEEKMTKRLVLEKQKYLEKRSIFSLNDDEELTHYGQTLSEIETFDKPPDSDDEEIDGRISGKMVAEEHFGGGILEKAYNDEKPWKERMEEMIIKTRKEKFEQQQERENAIKLTEEVDNEWKTLRYLMSGSTLKGADSSSTKRQVDDYDMNVRALGLEARAMATDKMKSEEELAKEEMERLEKLEKERQLRMKAPWEAEKKANRKYMSADALGDEQFLIPILKEKSKKDGKKKSVKFAGDSDEEEDDDNDEEEKDGEEEDVNGEEQEEEEDDSEADDSDDESKAEDSYSDIMSDEDEEKDKTKSEEDETSEDENEEGGETVVNQTKEERLAEISEKAKKQLPFTFEAPSTYTSFVKQLEGHSSDNKITIIERIQKCNHPSLADGNKKKLEKLFSFVLDYFCDLCNNSDLDLWLVDRLTVQLFQLIKITPKMAAEIVLAKIKKSQSKFSKTYPDMDTLMLLKLVPVLFPASDFRHLVCTPAMLFMGQILTQCPVKSGRDVAAGLFICSIFLQCVTSSKRFVPEVMNYLQGIFYIASSTDGKKSIQIFLPFKLVEPENKLLVVSGETESEETIQPLKLSYLKGCENNDDGNVFNCDKFRLCAIHVATGLSIEFCDLYKDLPSCPEIFSPIEEQLPHLTKEKYPKVLQERISKLEKQIDEMKQMVRFPLVQIVKQKLANLTMFEPRIEEVSDHRRKKSGSSAEANERSKLLYKVKKETKGAIREIKKDAQFLARHQRNEQLEKDSYRKRKVKEIYSQMENQEADYKEMKRKKEKEAQKMQRGK